MSITRPNALPTQLPARELNASLHEFLQPVCQLMPDVRLQAVLELMVHGIVSSQSAIVTQMARGADQQAETIWPACQRMYRFLSNERLSYRHLRKGLYRRAQRVVQHCRLPYLVIAIDPVNFEKPYAHVTEGVSTVHKSTPPDLQGQARLTHGYPAITATVVNTAEPLTSYAQWFSYTSTDFLSQNREIYRALRTSKALFPRRKLRFVGDSTLDDQKVFAQVAQLQAECVFRVGHKRTIERYDERQQAWHSTLLAEAASQAPFQFPRWVRFTHAGKTWREHKQFGWFPLRLPDSQQALWCIVVHGRATEPDLLLLTNVPLTSQAVVWHVFCDWRLRAQIEHGYRFDQEQGLDVEDMRVHTLERMRRLYLLVLLAAQFVAYIARNWTRTALRWLRTLGGKLDRSSDRDGLYLLLRGISAVWQTACTLAFLLTHPFPARFSTCV